MQKHHKAPPIYEMQIKAYKPKPKSKPVTEPGPLQIKFEAKKLQAKSYNQKLWPHSYFNDQVSEELAKLRCKMVHRRWIGSTCKLVKYQNEIPPLQIESVLWPQSQLSCAPSKMPQAAQQTHRFHIPCSTRWWSQKITAYSVIELFPPNPSSRVKSLASQKQRKNFQAQQNSAQDHKPKSQ